jgi:hypothetical protein
MTPLGGAAARRDVKEEKENRKPVIKPGVHLTLKVQDTAGCTLVRTVRRTEELQGLMDAYGLLRQRAGRRDRHRQVPVRRAPAGRVAEAGGAGDGGR